MRCRYYCPEHPPIPGTVPQDGLIATGDYPCWLHGVSCRGWCEYNRKLTADELRVYVLIGGEEMPEEGET